jgi:hypothetical protein
MARFKTLTVTNTSTDTSPHFRGTYYHKIFISKFHADNYVYSSIMDGPIAKSDSTTTYSASKLSAVPFFPNTKYEATGRWSYSKEMTGTPSDIGCAPAVSSASQNDPYVIGTFLQDRNNFLVDVSVRQNGKGTILNLTNPQDPQTKAPIYYPRVWNSTPLPQGMNSWSGVVNEGGQIYERISGDYTVEIPAKDANPYSKEVWTWEIRIPYENEVKLTANFQAKTLLPLADGLYGPADAGYTKLTITATRDGNPISTSVHLVAMADPTSGGHAHGSTPPPRHTGGFRPAGGKYDPILTAHDLPIGASGTATVPYVCSGFGGTDMVQVSATDAATITATLPVILPRLVNFATRFFAMKSEDRRNVAITGDQAKNGKVLHVENHWCTPNTANVLRRVILDWAHAQNTPGTMLLNDMSLQYGGPFDTDGNWGISHADNYVGHRMGQNADLQIDISTMDTVDVPHRTLENSIINALSPSAGSLLKHADGYYWHLSTGG